MLPALVLATLASSIDAPRYRFDAGLTFSRFEQQVKSSLGGARGERLVTETQVGYAQPLPFVGVAWTFGR